MLAVNVTASTRARATVSTADSQKLRERDVIYIRAENSAEPAGIKSATSELTIKISAVRALQHAR